MHYKTYRLLIFCAFMLLAGISFGQPFDLLIPTEQSPDSLSRELRSLHDIERDLAIEKLTREPSKLEAFIELGNLRLAEGKIQEAQRFFEMALEISPKNHIANQGLVMVHYRKGEFNRARELMENLHASTTIADDMKHELRDIKGLLKYTAQLGLTVREDDRGLSEVITSVEGHFPSFTYRKLTGRYRYENWTHEDNGEEANSQVLSSVFEYRADKNTTFSAGYAPELFSNKETIGGYNFQLITGSENLHCAASTNRQTFKENIFTVQNHLAETNHALTLYGDLHPRTRAVQTLTYTSISDGNNRRQFDSELFHYIYRHGAPFLSLTMRLSQMSYEKQTDSTGNFYNYWAPSDYKSGELTFSWERSIGSRWWWGIDTSLTGNSYKFISEQSISDTGAGALLHLSYNFDSGRLYASIGDRIHNYFRERKLEVYGSFEF
jgi:tetratricopeptide (TPR) repeat protein